MQLSKTTFTEISNTEDLSLPGESQFTLPEKVLQFGTGVLLRGLPDYFIDKANKQGLFNGRVVVVKSTDSGGTDAFEQQDGLYTHCIKGLQHGQVVNEYIINASISRVLSAKNQWHQILQVAQSPDLKLVISNTTEVGIVMSNDKINDAPPASFPGKLLSILYERYKAFEGSDESGLVIVPTELIIENGKKLKEIIIQLAEVNQLEQLFVDWLHDANHFCDSLVDRIVPGKIAGTEKEDVVAKLGYDDELMIMSEVFRLWAIKANHPKINEVISFAQADEGVVLAPDIEKFRELKLRLLNGTHTLSCALAYLAGFHTVKEAMADAGFEAFIQKLAKQEMAPALQASGIGYEEACAFADKVIERFKNPFLDHKWVSISFAYTSKMLLRDVPLIKSFYANPVNHLTAMALGFAAYILFMKTQKNGDAYEGKINNEVYKINDDKASVLHDKWQSNDPAKVVRDVLSDVSLWEEDLTVLRQFTIHVTQQLELLIKSGARQAMHQLVSN